MSINDLLKSYHPHRLHTELDDLEGFLWVIVVVAIEIRRGRRQKDAYGSRFLQVIRSTDFWRVNIAKEGLRFKLKGADRSDNPDVQVVPVALSGPLSTLLDTLFTVLTKRNDTKSGLIKRGTPVTDPAVQKLNEETGEEFFEVGFEQMEKLQKRW